jgi:archaellum biogenesis ATPase FlaH
MNNKKQKLLLEYLASSPDLFALCSGIVKPKYFDPEYRSAMKFIQTYYLEHNAIPDADQIEAETDVVIKTKPITKDQFKYCSNEIEAFCKQSAMIEAVRSAPALIDSEDYGALETNIKNAVTVSLNKNMGVDFFAEARQTLERLLSTGQTISTGWPDVDDVLFGGLQRKQLVLFSAGSGGGKSITMQNLGLNLVAQGLNVLYVSLELSEELLAERMAYLLSGIGKVEMREKFEDMMYGISQFASAQVTGKMMFKQMPAGINSNDIKSYLKEYELLYGHVPDAIICDYLDLMAPCDKVSADNVFEKDKRVAEELRNVAFDYNLIMITASQLNRSSVNADSINHSHIAGGISKINTADVYITIILSETLKAAGEIAFNYQKTRNSDGVGKTTYLTWGKSNLRIGNKDKNESSILKPVVSAVEKRGRSKLVGMFDDMDE